MRPLSRATVGVGLGLLLASSLACGQTSGSGLSPSGPTEHLATPPPVINETGRSANQVLADAELALIRSGSFHVHETLTRDSSTSVLDLSVAGTGKATGTVTMTPSDGSSKPMTVEVTILGTDLYLRSADLAAFIGAQGAAVGSRWLKLPLSFSPLADGLLVYLLPSSFAECTIGVHGTLSLVGATTVGDTPAIAIQDAGDLPGSTARTVYVATTGAEPLRIEQKSEARAGQPADTSCGPVSPMSKTAPGGANGPLNLHSPLRAATTDLSQFGTVAAVSPPTDLVDYGSLPAPTAH